MATMSAGRRIGDTGRSINRFAGLWRSNLFGYGRIVPVIRMKTRRWLPSMLLGGVILVGCLSGCIPFLEWIGLGQPGEGETPDLSWYFSRGECEGHGEVRFTAAPAEADDLSHIYPLGLMTGSHVTPVDHQYYYWTSLDVPVEQYTVHSPADGVVVEIAFQPPDYRLVIEHSCDVYTIWIHLEQLAGPLAWLDDAIPSGRPHYERIPGSAGELIAYDGGTNGFDFSVHDARVTLLGFVRPESYVVERWKIHTVDPYDYFDEPVRSHLLTKNVRQVEPLGGKIDHDIPGRLMGNWFVEGTNGYAGIAQQSAPAQPGRQAGYWSTHLAIAPDAIDPRAIIVSMPSFGDHRAQVAIGNLDPHPADVSVATGLVKYELVGWAYVRESTGDHWGATSWEATDDIVVEVYPHHVDGTVLLRLLEDHRLKFEAFPGLRSHEVSDFTDAARIYER
jgi:hypothetical protein